MTRAPGVLLAALLLAGCGGSDEPSGSDDAPHTEAAVEDLAQEQADRFSSGDFGGSWDLWTTEAQDVISREDFIAYSEECSGTGIPIDVTSVRLDDEDTATVRLGISGSEKAYTMRYEDGAWRWQPTDDALELYRLGTDGAIQQAKADGGCNG